MDHEGFYEPNNDDSDSNDIYLQIIISQLCKVLPRKLQYQPRKLVRYHKPHHSLELQKKKKLRNCSLFAGQLGNLVQTKEIWIINRKIPLSVLVDVNSLTFLRLFQQLSDRILGDFRLPGARSSCPGIFCLFKVNRLQIFHAYSHTLLK